MGPFNSQQLDDFADELEIAEQLRKSAKRGEDSGGDEGKKRGLRRKRSGGKKDDADGAPADLAEERFRLPKVNMLPPSLAIANRKRRLVRLIVIIGVGLTALMGLLWFSQGSAINQASERLEETQAQVQDAMLAAPRLKPIGEYMAGLQERVDIAVASTYEQLDYSAVIDGIYRAAPPGVTITEVVVDYAAPIPGTPPTCGTENDPLGAVISDAVIGCVTISGTATSSDALNQFARSIDEAPHLRYVLIIPGVPGEGSEGTPGALAFSGTAAVAADAAVRDQAMSLFNVTGVPGITVTDPAPPAPAPTESATPSPEATP